MKDGQKYFIKWQINRNKLNQKVFGFKTTVADSMKPELSFEPKTPQTPHYSLIAQTGTKGISREQTVFDLKAHPEETPDEVFVNDKGDFVKSALCENSTQNFQF